MKRVTCFFPYLQARCIASVNPLLCQNFTLGFCDLNKGLTEDEKVSEALDCPCVADVKNGPCGDSFINAFTCFLKSTEEEQVI